MLNQIQMKKDTEKMTEKKSKKRAGRMQKGEKLARQKDRVSKYKSEQQKKKKGKKSRKY